jgi:transcriptional regulator with XRE-family HTH domain
LSTLLIFPIAPAIVPTVEKQESPQRPTGLDLKFARLARGVRAHEIAHSLGVSPQRVSAIEAAFRPSGPMAARYLAALDAVAPPEEARPEAPKASGSPDRSLR